MFHASNGKSIGILDQYKWHDELPKDRLPKGTLVKLNKEAARYQDELRLIGFKDEESKAMTYARIYSMARETLGFTDIKNGYLGEELFDKTKGSK